MVPDDVLRAIRRARRTPDEEPRPGDRRDEWDRVVGSAFPDARVFNVTDFTHATCYSYEVFLEAPDPGDYPGTGKEWRSLIRGAGGALPILSLEISALGPYAALRVSIDELDGSGGIRSRLPEDLDDVFETAIDEVIGLTGRQGLELLTPEVLKAPLPPDVELERASRPVVYQALFEDAASDESVKLWRAGGSWWKSRFSGGRERGRHEVEPPYAVSVSTPSG